MYRPLLVAALATLAACEHSHGGEPTGSVCPPGSTLTYDTFGRDFLEDHCTRCHASTRTGSDRHGAPSFHDYDTLEGLRNTMDHVDAYAAAGPDAVNTLMPPTAPKPTEAQRFQLGEWIACGAP